VLAQVYELYVYPRFNHTGQRAWVVPLTSGNPTLPGCDLACLDEQVLTNSTQYLAWSLNDTRIVGWNGFHLPTYEPTDVGLQNLTRSLAWYQELGWQMRNCTLARSGGADTTRLLRGR
jgi:hypothetical protein